MIDPISLTAPLADQDPGVVSIQIEVTSDNEPASFADSFRLWINDVEITDFSAINSPPWTVDMDVTLLGGQTVKVKFQATDNDETKSSVWIFSINSERRTSEDQYHKAASLQAIANYYPEYTKARSEEHSIFRQLMNPLGLEIDTVKLRLHNQNRALNLSKNQWNDPDWLYQYPLDVGEEFYTRLDSSGNKSYVAPSVWGIRDINRLPLETTEEFITLWTNAKPTRYIATSQGSKNTQLTPSTPIREVAALGSITVPVPGFIYVMVHSAVNTVSIDEGLSVTNLVLNGKGAEGLEQSETIALMRNGTFPTQKTWSYVESVDIIGGPNTATAEFILYNFPQRAVPKEDPLLKGGNEEVIRWKLRSDTEGSVLDREIPGNSFLIDMVKSEDSFYPERTYRLRDTQGNDITVTDFCIDPTSFKMYGIDTNKLYVWDRRDVWPSTIQNLTGSATSPEIDFFIQEYGAKVEADGLGNFNTDITIELDGPKGRATVYRWNWSIITSNGTRKYFDLENNIDESGPYWRYNPTPIDYFGIKQPRIEMTFTTVEPIIVELNIEFVGGTSEVVRKFWVGRELIASADYKVSQILDLVSTKPSIAAMEDGRIAVTESGETWLLTPQFDTFIADFESYRLLFREAFDSVEVKFDGE